MEDNMEAFAEADDIEGQTMLHHEYLDLMDDMVNTKLCNKYS